MTIAQLKAKAQKISGDASSATLSQFETDINIGANKLNSAMNNYFNRRSKSTNMIADQQYYQLPPDCIRVIGVDFVISADRRLPLTQIRSEYQWRQINYAQQSSNWLTYYFVKGADEIGLFPIPSDNLSAGVIIYYEPRSQKQTASDYATGTVAVTSGLTTVTGTGTVFTADMVGREFQVTDGSDGYNYRIAGFTSGTEVTLEEPYIGFSGSGKTFNIGQSFLFPEEYHENTVDYALYRFFEMNNNPERANYHKVNFDNAIAEVKDKYASSSASQVITDEGVYYDPFQDNTKAIIET